MKRILVATDFSARSDRAIRRGILLARPAGAAISLVHAVDDDQPDRLVRAERTVAEALLGEQARSLRDIDGLDCEPRVALGDPFHAIAGAAGEIGADLVVIGPHRRRLLNDVFTGTTAERTIRACDRPVLMANGVPAGPHRHVLVAVDMSDQSGAALRAVADLDVARQATVTILHVFDAPGTGPVAGAGLTRGQLDDYLATEERRAGEELAAFLQRQGFAPGNRLLKPGGTNPAHVIEATARAISADLVVVGTHGRSGIAKLFLGSVTKEVLRMADRDVLAIPNRRKS